MSGDHVELPGSYRPSKQDAQRLRDVDPNAPVEVTVTIAGPQLPAPGATSHPALSPAEFAERYGAPQADVATVETVLQSYGLTVRSVSGDRRSLKVTGPASAMEAAFQPHLGIYRSQSQGEYRGREGALTIPAKLEGIVTGVFGLDQRQVAYRRPRVATAARHVVTAGTPLTPSDLEQRYNFPPGAAAGQTVAIAEFGIPVSDGSVIAPAYFPADVQQFCTQYSRQAPTVQVTPLNVTPLTLQQLQELPAQTQSTSADLTGEVMMDVEIVAALCSAATVVMYFATFDQMGWIDILDKVVSGDPARPVSLSCSWGNAEDSPDWAAGALTEINNRLQAASMQGITICVSAGDDGSGDAVNDAKAHVDFPAASPFVLAVGGTMLDAGGQEVTWWQSPGHRTPHDTGATGGGVSALTPRPAWQTVAIASINAGSIDGRVVPDVAALAGPPLYALVLNGGSAPNGGTSASAPLWASLIARVNAVLPTGKSQQFITPLLYAADASGTILGKKVCRDIIVGQNASHPKPGKGYAAGPGYDAVSGWGVPNGVALTVALS